MHRLHESGQLVGGNEGDIVPATAADDNDVTVLSHFITELCEIRSSGRVSCLNCHKFILSCEVVQAHRTACDQSRQAVSTLRIVVTS